jgi:hypothetical protein
MGSEATIPGSRGRSSAADRAPTTCLRSSRSSVGDQCRQGARIVNRGVSWPGKSAKSLSAAGAVIPRVTGQPLTDKGSTAYFAFHALNPPARATAL